MAEQQPLMDEVNAKRGTRNMVQQPKNPIAQTCISRFEVGFNQKFERCYFLKGGLDNIRIETTEADNIAKFVQFVPDLSTVDDSTKFEISPMLDVEFKKQMGEDKFLHFELLSVVQRPDKKQQVKTITADEWFKDRPAVYYNGEVVTKIERHPIMETEVYIFTASGIHNTPEQVKLVVGDNKVSEIPFDELQHSHDVAASAQSEAENTASAELAKDLDERFGPKREIWSADTSKPGQSQNIAAWKHFERECIKADPTCKPTMEVKRALVPCLDIPEAIGEWGWPVTRDKLQFWIERLRTIRASQPVEEKTAVAETKTKHWSEIQKNLDTVIAKLQHDAELMHIAHEGVIAAAEDAAGKMADYDTGAAFILATLNEWRKPVVDESEPEDDHPDIAENADPEPPAALSPVAPADAVIKPTGEVIKLPRDPNTAILHVKSTKALVDHMFNDKVLIAGVDYGTLPNGRENAKPSLLKPGAEKLLDAFQFYPVFKPTANSKSDWTGNGFFNFEYECVICDRVTGRVEGSGIGSCNSKESKYRYRWLYDNEAKAQGFNLAEMVKKSFKGRNDREYFKYRVDNEDIFDIVNTLSKMAQKRALVAATLNATGASAVFTQDTEDFADWGLVD